MSTSDAFILEDLINFYHLLAVFIYLFVYFKSSLFRMASSGFSSVI